MSGKYYISVDCEGVACAAGIPGVGLGDGDGYRFAAREATLEAAAAAGALFDAGAERVIVWDSHGGGVNLDYDLLDPRCEILLGAGHRGRFVGLEEDFTAVLFIGYHAMAGSPGGTLSHTYSSKAFQSYRLNGRPVGELAVDAAYAGEKGVPVLFCAGDDFCVREARAFFGDIAAVETKRSLSWSSALSRHPQAVRRDIRDTVLAAAQAGPRVPPFTIPGPVEAEIRYQRSDAAASAQLTDMYGRPFSSPDPYTRKGVLRSVTDLF